MPGHDGRLMPSVLLATQACTTLNRISSRSDCIRKPSLRDVRGAIYWAGLALVYGLSEHRLRA